MPRTVLVRHADVENPRGIFYGHLDTFGLSALGRAQARELGPALADLGVQKIVHSPLRRARETAELAASRMSGEVELVEESALIELEFGKYLQGVAYWQIPFRRPLWLIHYFRRGLLHNDESVQTMGQRIVRVAEQL